MAGPDARDAPHTDLPAARLEALRDERGPERPAGRSPAFHLLAKPTGARLQPRLRLLLLPVEGDALPGLRFRMADELLETYLRQLIEAHAGVPEVTIAWQGGEPTLMGIEFFRRSVELAERYLRPGSGPCYTIQTNGTLIDAEWAAFFKANDFLVGISIDGPREIHDTYRVSKGGARHLRQVMGGLGHLPRPASSGTR